MLFVLAILKTVFVSYDVVDGSIAGGRPTSREQNLQRTATTSADRQALRQRFCRDDGLQRQKLLEVAAIAFKES